MPLALSTGHEVGLAVTGAAFIAFALASAFLFPRLRPDYPGPGLRAFIVVAFVFFFGMLTAVEVFGADSKKKEQSTQAAQTTSQPTSATVSVTESEFKIALASTTLKAGTITFNVKNAGHIAHDLAIKGGKKTSLIQPGGTAQLTVDLKPGKYHLYCTVPGHEAAGMKVDVTVS